MANQTFTLTVSRVDAPLFDGSVTAVTVPAVTGEMQLLAHHEAFITPLQAGVVTITREDGGTETYEIAQGTLEASHNHVTILV